MRGAGTVDADPRMDTRVKQFMKAFVQFSEYGQEKQAELFKNREE